MSSADERLRVLVEDVVLVGLPAGNGTPLPPYGAAEAGMVLTVSADGSTVEWRTPVFASARIGVASST
jgi:hypothetical protein